MLVILAVGGNRDGERCGALVDKLVPDPRAFMPDPRAPIFFLGYSRTRLPNRPVSGTYEVDEKVKRVFVDLSTNVAQLIPLPPGQDYGFMDTTIEGGEIWKNELLRAARRCQVFVALISDPYLHSEWCAMEWDLFSRRRVIPRSDEEPTGLASIVPVLWAPVRENESSVRTVPERIGRVQLFEPTDLPDTSFGPLYRANGLFGLLTMHHPAYDSIVWKLAMRIQRLYAAQWVEPIEIEIKDIDALRRTFEED